MRIEVPTQDVEIPLESSTHLGFLAMPPDARGIVLFAHGSGSSRLSRRNRFVADELAHNGLGTLLFDLLTEIEDRHYANRFDIDLLTHRLLGATSWVRQQPGTRELPVGYFGASTGAAAALKAATVPGNAVRAVVSRGGRPDMVLPDLARVQAPTLLIVGGDDDIVIGLNQEAFKALRCEKVLQIVPGATHLFEEPGALEQVAYQATEWFLRHMGTTN
jgi:putative phosphoribosyl transferase